MKCKKKIRGTMMEGLHTPTDLVVIVTPIEWIHQALHFDAAVEAEIVSVVPSIPLSLAGMPYCEACESVLCGACGHCHMLDVVPFTRPECPLDNDDIGHDCMVWWQAFKAIHTVQHMNEE